MEKDETFRKERKQRREKKEKYEGKIKQNLELEEGKTLFCDPWYYHCLVLGNLDLLLPCPALLAKTAHLLSIQLAQMRNSTKAQNGYY